MKKSLVFLGLVGLAAYLVIQNKSEIVSALESAYTGIVSPYEGVETPYTLSSGPYTETGSDVF